MLLLQQLTKQKQLLHWLAKAEEDVKRAVQLDDGNADAHIWVATVLGKKCDHVATKERIALGKEVQEHLERATGIRDTDYIASYTYGRWCFEVASLSWIERKLAAALFGTPPEATFADAMSKFRTVQRLKPEWKANMFWIAKTAVQMKDYDEAIKSADEAHALSTVDEEDVVCEKELQDLRRKYASYR